MSEEVSISLEDPKTGRISTHSATRTRLPTTTHSVEGKNILNIYTGRQPISLIERFISFGPHLVGFDNTPRTPADKFIFANTVLGDRGFNVVKRIRKVDSSYIAETNLAADGSCIYDVKLDRQIEVRNPNPLDIYFANIHTLQIQTLAAHLENLANTQGVVFPNDSITHVMVKPDGSWNTIFLDISAVKIYFNPKHISDIDVQNNSKRVSKWVNSFIETQQRILKDLSSN